MELLLLCYVVLGWGGGGDDEAGWLETGWEGPLNQSKVLPTLHEVPLEINFQPIRQEPSKTSNWRFPEVSSLHHHHWQSVMD